MFCANLVFFVLFRFMYLNGNTNWFRVACYYLKLPAGVKWTHQFNTPGCSENILLLRKVCCEDIFFDFIFYLSTSENNVLLGSKTLIVNTPSKMEDKRLSYQTESYYAIMENLRGSEVNSLCLLCISTMAEHTAVPYSHGRNPSLRLEDALKKRVKWLMSGLLIPWRI